MAQILHAPVSERTGPCTIISRPLLLSKRSMHARTADGCRTFRTDVWAGWGCHLCRVGEISLGQETNCQISSICTQSDCLVSRIMPFINCIPSSSRALTSSRLPSFCRQKAGGAIQHARTLKSSAVRTSKAASPGDPLRPDVPLSEFQLPLHPLPPPIPRISESSAITRPVLHRLHRLSALNPPAENSPEEEQLTRELNGLVGLMDLVKAVELPKDLDMADLLSEGRGEILVDGSHLDEAGSLGEEGRKAKLAAEAKEAEKGRELLAYATKTTGEYHSSRSNRKSSA